MEGVHQIIGPPGTGKTTTIARMVADEAVRGARTLHPFPVLVCSLTRAAAAEAAGRNLPINRNAIGTLHSHCYRAIGCPPIAETKVDEFNTLHPTYRLDDGGRVDIEEMAEGADDRAVMPDGLDTQHGDGLSQQYHHLRAVMRDRSLWPVPVQGFAAAWESWKAEAGVVDFTDMIEQGAGAVPEFRGHAPRAIFVDEAQDFSRLELETLRSWAVASEAFAMIGDPYQSLYHWRGAFPQMFDDPRVTLDRRRVLDQSHRVPRAVHKVAVAWIKRHLSTWRPIDYRPTDQEGEVVLAKNTTWGRVGKAMLRLIESELGEGRSVMIQAACGYMLGPTIKALRAAAIPFANPWRRKRGDWNPLGGGHGTSMSRRLLDLVRPAEPSEESQGLWTWQELHNWASVIDAAGTLLHGAKTRIKARALAEPSAAATFDDLSELIDAEALVDLWDSAFGGQVDSLLTWWGDRLMRVKRGPAEYPLRIARERSTTALTETPKCYVGTIHSFKGGEADTVIVFPDLSPNGDREWGAGPGPWRDAIARLGYVAMTRARSKLIICAGCSTREMPIAEVVRA